MDATREPLVPAKRLLLRFRVVLYLLAGLAAVDVVVDQFADVWRSYEPHPYIDHLRACRAHPWDLVVVGGSPAAYGFDPTVLAGMHWQGHRLDRVYNLGLILATAAEVYHATVRALPEPPRLLVYGITASDLNDDRLEPNGPRQLMTAADVVTWCRERPDAADWCLRHYLDERVQRLWKLYYYRNGIRAWAAAQAQGLWSGDGLASPLAPLIHINVDSTERLDHLRAQGKVKKVFPFLDNFHIGSYLTYLHRLLDWGDRHGVPIVLVDLPVSAELEERVCPRPFAVYRAALDDLERKRGVRVLRATRAAVGLTDAHFADLIHLNGEGKARLSAWVRRELTAIDRSPPSQGISYLSGGRKPPEP
jgi:hypothetical protein